MKHEVKRIGVLSIMKLSAAIGLVLGILYVLIMSPFFLLGGMASGSGYGIAIILVMIVCIIIFFPIIMAVSYGLMAILYNFFAKTLGGVEVEFSERK